MLSRPIKRRSTVRWLAPAAVFALTPKCLLCVLAYVGLGSAFGLGSQEICSSVGGTTESWASTLVWLGLTGMTGFGIIRAKERKDAKARSAR